MIYHFGAYSLETETLELKSGSETITVEPQVFRLLQYLIENRARVVSRDDIIDAVWKGRVVSDSALTYAVSEGRRLVGDDGKMQAVIRTLPRRGFRFVAEVTEESIGEEAAASKSSGPPPLANHDKPSIAVLPFDNLSDDPQQEYFSDGMAEDLITDISKISGVSVTARNPSFAFKGQTVDVLEIAKKLGVRHIVKGSVRKMGSKLRINAQLIDAASDGHIWAERYDGDMENIFEFQDDIREQIVAALRVSLTPTDKALTERKLTESAEAYELFLKGRAFLHRATHKDMLEAIKCLEAAIEIDPYFADAYSYLSHCFCWGRALIWPGFDDTLDRANEMAEKGVELDRTSAIALTRLVWIQTWLRRYDQAIMNLEKSITLAPNNAEVYATGAQVLNYWGDPESALEMIEKALNSETFAPPLWKFYAGLSHYLLRQYDEAVTRFNQTVERAPKISPAYLHLACAYVELNRLNDARDAIKKALEITPRYSLKEVDRIFPYRIDEVRNRVFDALRKAGLPEG